MRWLRVYVCLRKAFLSASPKVVDCTNFFTLKVASHCVNGNCKRIYKLEWTRVGIVFC